MELTEQQRKIKTEIADAIVGADAALLAVYGDRVHHWDFEYLFEAIQILAAGFLSGRRNFPIGGDRLL